ncbi:MAG: Hpt domain-containing protein [Pontixanthobacter sp.]
MESTLAAAAGSDPGLRAELRAAFADSLAGHVDLMKRARCDGNWNIAAMRLKGLAAGFHADDLIQLADMARNGAPGDPAVLKKIERYLSNFMETR